MKKRSLSRRRRIGNATVYTVLSILAVVWLLPIVYLFLMSLRAEPGAYLDDYIMPKGYTLGNYARLFTDTQQFNFPQWYLNTFIVAVFSCLIATIFILFTAYALSRLRFRARRPIMNVMLVLGMFPGFMSMIAVYHLVKLIGLDQTLAALVLVYSGGAALTYYIIKGFFDTIPVALDEAAYLDGCTKWQTFWKVTLPMSRPIITYTVLTTFMVPWLDFILSSVIMKDNYNGYTVALGLFQMLDKGDTLHYYFTAFCAGAVLVSIPIAVLFIIMQRNYVEGVTGGAVKG